MNWDSQQIGMRQHARSKLKVSGAIPSVSEMKIPEEKSEFKTTSVSKSFNCLA